MVVIAAWFAQVEISGDQYAVQSTQGCEQQNFGATGHCLNAYPTGPMNEILDTMIIILLAGAVAFLVGSFFSARRNFGWRGGAMLGTTCSAILLVLLVANSGPSPYGASTPIGTELAVSFESVRCMNSSGSPQCHYVFDVNDTAGNVTANDVWLALGYVALGGQNGSASSLGTEAILNSTTEGCIVSVWSFTSHAWSAPSSAGCIGMGSSSPLKNGEMITVLPSCSGRYLSGNGYELVFVGNTNALAGWTSAPIP